MSIDNLTIGEAKQLAALFGGGNQPTQASLNCMIGQKVIIRTYTAGVWFGELQQKAGNEVILINARRLWQWKAAKSISLSAVALYGLDYSGSKVVSPVLSIWLEAIEIMPCSADSISSIEGAADAKAN
jgi:hypothetical protein